MIVVVPHEFLHIVLLLFSLHQAHAPGTTAFVELGNRVDGVSQTFKRVLDWECSLQAERTKGDENEDEWPR